MVGGITQAKLRGIIQPFAYSDVQNLLGTERLYYDPRYNRIRLDGFIPEDYVERDLEGTGIKLVKLAQKRIETELQELEVKAVTGYEPKFFIRELGGNHPFLIVNTRGQEDFTVVDPSFKYIGPLEGSGYEMLVDWVDFTPLDHSYIGMGDETSIPLILNINLELVRLGLKFEESKLKLTVHTQHPRTNRSSSNFEYEIDTTTKQHQGNTPNGELEEKVKELVMHAQSRNLQLP